MLLLALPALVLIGVPLTSGALAKSMFETAVVQAPSAWAELLLWLLPVIAVGTALLMARFYYLMHHVGRAGEGQRSLVAFPWMGLVVLSLLLPLLDGGPFVSTAADVWPLLVATVVIWFVMVRRPSWLARNVGRVPPGDVVEPLAAALRWLVARAQTGASGVVQGKRYRRATA